jgi:hypothetical protein
VVLRTPVGADGVMQPSAVNVWFAPHVVVALSQPKADRRTVEATAEARKRNDMEPVPLAR